MARDVLIVDDDYDIRETLTQVLEDDGYQVRTAVNGVEALELLRRGPAPGMVLRDLMMPVMDGWEFHAERARAPELSKLPVVLLTADLAAVSRVEKAGAQGFLAKPVRLEALLETVQRWTQG